MRQGVFVVLFFLSAVTPAGAQKEYGFDNRKASGQPYLQAEESVARMRLAPGWEISVFAAEPDVINPIAFTVDERGRLWVVECFEYPSRTPPGKMPRDRIKVLEDTDGDGKADKVTVFAEGKDFPVRFDLASGIEVGHGGVFLGAAPHLFFLQDTTGDGKADRYEILLTGFGSQDTHETLNTFQWGPDGWLYGLHGVFTHSKIGDVQLNAAVWRYEPRRRKFEVFAEGTSNPWGMDWDRHGQAFLTACVIPHCFHIIPGGRYIRQAGTSFNPHTYGLLKEISDHLHHAESGWAHAGALVLQGDHVPQEYQGSLLMGSIHGCSIKRDLLIPRGSTFVARHAPDFLVSGDKNFRPINLRWGPGGEIYVIDWHDQNPCHQAEPDSWDKERGRIYAIRRSGSKPTLPGDLSRKSGGELVELLKHNNPWWHRHALRLLNERRDRSVAQSLEKLASQQANDALALRGLWGLFALGALDDKAARELNLLQHRSPWVRSWTVRLLGEEKMFSQALYRQLHRTDAAEDAPLRLQLACTAQQLSGPDRLDLLQELMQHPEDVRDPCIPLMLWLAYEPRLVTERTRALAWLTEHAADSPLLIHEIVPRVMRRLAVTGREDDLDAGLQFATSIPAAARRRALQGLLEGLQGRLLDPPPSWKAAAARLAEDSETEVRRLAGRLAVHFRDLAALERTVAVAVDPTKPVNERLEALRDIGTAYPANALRPLLKLVTEPGEVAVRCQACRALAAYDAPEVAPVILAAWETYSPELRVEAVSLLAGRKLWADALLAAVGRKQVPRTDLNDNTILRIRAHRDDKLNRQIEAVWGRVRDTPTELQALIDRLRGKVQEGRASFERGRQVFEVQCAKCHKFEGRGHEVGPNLDGAARDLEYLLVNVLDPNRVVGQPYYARFVTLKNGRVETGLLAGEDEQSLTLKTENDNVRVLPKREIEEVIVQEKSVMPEGLANNMTEQDFRDLVRYLLANPFLTEVAVLGPLDPAVKLDVPAAGRPPAPPGLSWSYPAVGLGGRIGLPRATGEMKLAVVVAAVGASEPLRTRLQLGAGHPVAVWLNGTKVYEGRPGTEAAAPDQVNLDVELQAGQNWLVFQVRYQGTAEALYARLLDPLRKLTHVAPSAP